MTDRELLYQFSILALSEQWAIIEKLKLEKLKEGDERPNYYHFLVAFKSARENDQLRELQTEIEIIKQGKKRNA